MAACEKIRFCDANLFQGGVTYTYSSQQTGYEAANAQTTVRSDWWSPSGTFLITTSNYAVSIYDTVNKTLFLTPGTYTPAGLASHIQTTLNAGSSGWTCTYSTTTHKFTITRSSTGKIRLSSGNAFWDTVGYLGTDDRTGTSFPADAPRNHTSEWLMIDAGMPYTVGCLAAIGVHGEHFTISHTADVRLQANNVDLWTAPALDVSITPTPEGVFYCIPEADQSAYRYWRFVWIDRENPVGPTGFKISHIYIGDYTSIETSNIGSGISRQQVDPTVQLESEGGQRYFDRRTKYETFSGLSFAFMTAAERYDLQQIFNDYGTDTPLFVAIDPTEAISADGADHMRLVYFAKEPSFTHIIRDLYSMSLDLREHI